MRGLFVSGVNGEIFELDEVPELELRKKHTIEAVVDRFRVREDVKQRLSESVETAIRLSDGPGHYCLHGQT